MQLTFICCCDPNVSVSVANVMTDRITQCCGGYDWQAFHRPAADISTDGTLEVRFQTVATDGSNAVGHVAAEREVAELLHLLSRLSAEFKIAWMIGHQMEPSLGRIVDGKVPPELIGEIATSLRVAACLAQWSAEEEAAARSAPSAAPGDRLQRDVPTALIDDGDDSIQHPSWFVEESFTLFPEIE